VDVKLALIAHRAEQQRQQQRQAASSTTVTSHASAIAASNAAGGGVLSAAFSNASEEADSVQNKARAAFIAERLKSERMRNAQGTANQAPLLLQQAAMDAAVDEAAGRRALSEEDKLYQTPAHLQRKAADATESSDRWLTGLAEVELPIEVKLHNIERTEVATKAREQRYLERKREYAQRGRVPASFNANYRKHKQLWDAKARASDPARQHNRDNKDRQGGPPPPPTTLMEAVAASEQSHRHRRPKSDTPYVPKSSDSRVVARFVKRQKFRR
jgi:hypothetical protein